MFCLLPEAARYLVMMSLVAAGPIGGASFPLTLNMYLNMYLNIIQGSHLLSFLLVHDALVPYIPACKMFE